MGFDEKQEHLLCLVPFPEPKAIIDRIRQQFPNLKVTYKQSSLAFNWEKDQGLPDGTINSISLTKCQANTSSIDIWKDVIILSTLSQFPKAPQLAPKLGKSNTWRHPISSC